MKTYLTLLAFMVCPWVQARSTVARVQVVAAVLIGEAGGERTAGLTAVAEVIRNRMSLSGQDAFAEVTRLQQFSSYNGHTPLSVVKKHKDHPRWEQALALARKLYEEPGQLSRTVGAATHFDRVKSRPHWSKGLTPVAIVGNHAFYHVN